MNHLKTSIQVFFICLLSFLGQQLSEKFHLPIPGNLLAMFILLALLCTGIVKERHIDRGADLLLKYMSLFFIPAGVGLLAYWHILAPVFAQWLLLLFVSTAVLMAATGKIVNILISRAEVRR